VGDRTGPLDVLIVEDSETDTKLLIQELRRGGFSPHWERVETAPTLRAALTRRRWQLVISDSGMPRLNALEALALSKEVLPDVPFIIVSATITEETAVQAIRMGAADYVTKEHLDRLGAAVARELGSASRSEVSPAPELDARGAGGPGLSHALFDEVSELLATLRLTVQSAQRRRGPSREKVLADVLSLIDQVIPRVRAMSRSGRTRHAPAAQRLTPRQLEVLKLIAEGHSTKEIAVRLELSAKTVESHRAQIMDRLGINHVAGLVHYAIRFGIVSSQV